MTGSGFGYKPLSALLTVVVSMCQGRVRLVTSCWAEIFSLVEDLGRGLEILLESPRPYKGCWPPYLDIGVSNRFRDRDILFGADFLANQFFCEDSLQGGGVDGLLGSGVERWRQGLGKISLNIVPASRNFVLRQTNPSEVACSELLQMKRL